MQKAYIVLCFAVLILFSANYSSAANVADSIQTEASVQQSTNEQKDKFKVSFGGLLRFTYNYSDWKSGQQTRGGDFGYDVFGLKAVASYNDFFLNAEYRFYSDPYGGPFLKHGWMGYHLSEKSNIQLGLTKVPFGITDYNSNSFFFSLACYAGFEDDYDMGIKYSYVGEHFDYAFAFFKNAEEYSYGNNTDASPKRFAYDLGSIDANGDGVLEYRNKEINQLNGQLFYKIDDGLWNHRFGGSVQYSGVYNLDTESVGSHYAYALHYELTAQRWNVMAQAMHYTYNAKGPQGEDDRVIAVGAWGAPYLIASDAQIYTFNVSYALPVSLGAITSLKFYNDYGYMQKNESEGFYDTQQNVTGVAVSAGPIYTYIDYGMGKNHSWLGDEWTKALGTGTEDAEWSSRFNINIGYYF